MRAILLIAASVAFVVVCNVSSLGQAAADHQDGSSGNQKTPDEARRKSGKSESASRKSKAKVTLKFIIRPSGEAEFVKVLKVTPKDMPKEVADELVKKAIEAVKKLKFSPPMKNGRRVSQYGESEYNFSNEEKLGERN